MMTRQRWHALMNAFVFPENNETCEALQKAYGERHRHYHTQAHVSACLHHLESARDLAERPEEIEMALWFHDAIYKPYSTDNEKKSALWAATFLERNRAEKNVVDRIYSLIMATQHDALPSIDDERLLVDIDLAILGATPDVYQQFETNVRREYRWVPMVLYRKKRAEILESFLRRDVIYSTDYFQKRNEVRARENLRNAIQTLR